MGLSGHACSFFWKRKKAVTENWRGLSPNACRLERRRFLTVAVRPKYTRPGRHWEISVFLICHVIWFRSSTTTSVAAGREVCTHYRGVVGEVGRAWRSFFFPSFYSLDVQKISTHSYIHSIPFNNMAGQQFRHNECRRISIKGKEDRIHTRARVERQRETETRRDRHDRQTDRQTETKRDWEKDRQTDRDRVTEIHTEGGGDRETETERGKIITIQSVYFWHAFKGRLVFVCLAGCCCCCWGRGGG